MYVFNRYRFKVFDKTASLIELGLSLPPRFVLFFFKLWYVYFSELNTFTFYQCNPRHCEWSCCDEFES